MPKDQLLRLYRHSYLLVSPPLLETILSNAEMYLKIQMITYLRNCTHLVRLLQCEILDVLTQFHEKFPDYIHLIPDFTSLSPVNLIVKMGGVYWALTKTALL